MEQVSKTAAESSLAQAWAILPVPRFLTRGSTLGRVPPPPRRGLGRLQLLQPLPLIGRHQHDGLVTRTRDSDWPATGLYLICGRGQPVGIIALLVAHNISMLCPACRPPGHAGSHPETPGNLRAGPVRRKMIPPAAQRVMSGRPVPR